MLSALNILQTRHLGLKPTLKTVKTAKAAEAARIADRDGGSGGNDSGEVYQPH